MSSRSASPSSAPPSSGRITLREVARALGVSVATVSNAYNRPDQLSAALRERVLDEEPPPTRVRLDPVRPGSDVGLIG